MFYSKTLLPFVNSYKQSLVFKQRGFTVNNAFLFSRASTKMYSRLSLFGGPLPSYSNSDYYPGPVTPAHKQ